MRYISLLILLLCLSCGESRKKGNSTILFELEPAAATSSGQDQTKLFDEVIAVYKERLEKYGYAEEDFTIKNNGRTISVTLRHTDTASTDMRRIPRLLQYQGKVEFWETYDVTEIFNNLNKVNESLRDTTAISADTSGTQPLATEIAEGKRSEELEQLKKNPLFARLQPPLTTYERGSMQQLHPGPVMGYTEEKHIHFLDSLFAAENVRSLLPYDLKPTWLMKKDDRNRIIFELIALKASSGGKGALSDIQVEHAEAVKSEYGAQMEVSIEMNTVSAENWKRLTKKNTGKAIAIVLNGRVTSYPTVQGEISGGKSVISGNFTKEEAEEIAGMLKTKPLPVEMRIVSRKVE
ncbi:MAG: SecD/SecF fusion protein [Bacteroidetes bacterium]|nr:MAG: SecD/SecF fusion protein [Bacteroidota bacterium]